MSMMYESVVVECSTGAEDLARRKAILVFKL